MTIGGYINVKDGVHTTWMCTKCQAFNTEEEKIPYASTVKCNLCGHVDVLQPNPNGSMKEEASTRLPPDISEKIREHLLRFQDELMGLVVETADRVRDEDITLSANMKAHVIFNVVANACIKAIMRVSQVARIPPQAMFDVLKEMFNQAYIHSEPSDAQKDVHDKIIDLFREHDISIFEGLQIAHIITINGMDDNFKISKEKIKG